MKKKSSLIVLLVAILSFAQDDPFSAGSVELNFSADFGTVSVTNYKAYFFSTEEFGSTTSKYAFISISPGHYLWNHFSFEPEVGFQFVDNMAPAFYFVPSFSYSVIIKNPVGFFLKAGIGYASSISFLGICYKAPGKVVKNKLDTPLLNLGTGLKIFISEDILIRTEINYKFAQQELHEYGIAYSNVTNLRLIFGISAFL